MQFIWLYIDEMMGKGIKWYVIAELLFYSSANLVPLALPLAMLLSSLMTFGNLGEHLELVAFKSAGIPFQKIIRPLVIFAIAITISSFLFSNYIIPIANLKFYSLLHDVREKKPALNIKPGSFYNEIDGYIIRIDDKTPKGDYDMLKKVMIYNHTEDNGCRKITVADSGIMKMAYGNRYLSIKLFNGVDYQEEKENSKIKHFPLTRFYFEENEVLFDVSAFQLNRTNEDLFKDDYRMLSLKQLDNRIDTFDVYRQQRLNSFVNSILRSYTFNDTIPLLTNNENTNTANKAQLNVDGAIQNKYLKKSTIKLGEYINSLTKNQKTSLYSTAVNLARTNKGIATSANVEINLRDESIRHHLIEWHKKITLAAVCLIMFFIGAPLGAIVRKGGLGLPVVISVFFFLLFWVLLISGEKMAKEAVIPPYQGLWIAVVILFPISMFITYQAINDNNFAGVRTFFDNIFALLKRKKE